MLVGTRICAFTTKSARIIRRLNNYSSNLLIQSTEIQS